MGRLQNGLAGLRPIGEEGGQALIGQRVIEQLPQQGRRQGGDIGAHGALTNAQYDALEPVRWGGTPFADGRFPTPDGKAHLVPVEQRELGTALRALEHRLSRHMRPLDSSAVPLAGEANHAGA